jgi:HSP20 family protein
MAAIMVRNYPSILDEVQTLVDSLEGDRFVACFVPGMNMDMVEDKDELIVRLELPGIKKEDIDITVDGRMLLIEAQKKSPEFSKEAKFYTCEQCFGTYSRSVELPFDVIADKISSRFEDGILEIRLPRTEESKPRHIAISGTRKQLTARAKAK